MRETMSRQLLVAVLATAATVAIAQPASAPTAVGVTPATAADANQKAIPRSDTATVVRTGPTAGDRARSAASTASGAMSNAADKARSMASSASGAVSSRMSDGNRSSSTMTSDASGTGSRTGTRRVKADRN